MKIIFDHQVFEWQSYGGISRYFVRLVEGLARLGERATIVAPFHMNRYLRDLDRKNVFGRELDHFPPNHYRTIAVANRTICASWIFCARPDIVHETYFASHPVKGRAKARVLTVYDMIHEKLSGEFGPADQTSRRKRAAVARADHVISISHSTKRDLCELFDVPPEKVSVVHLGVDGLARVGEPGGVATRFDARPFLLYVGQRGGYKNFEGFLRAFATRRRLVDELDIVAFGGGPFNVDERELFVSLKLRKDSVHQLSGLDDALNALYRRARAFVYPSLYEGFGLPPLEAMANGCPVVSSNTSSMPEVVADGGELFDPFDAGAQADAIERAALDTAHRDRLIERGQARLKHFSWERCAMQTQAVYRVAAGV